jgi:hypothetical protein
MDMGIVGALPILFVGLFQFAWYIGVVVMLDLAEGEASTRLG